MNLKPLAGLLLLLLLLSPALAADTEVIKLWEQNMAPHDVNSVDTDETGTFTYYGLSNGSVGAYSAAGVSQWITLLNASVKKIKKSPYTTYLVAMTTRNESYLISTTDGSIYQYAVGIPALDGWIMDVDIARDGLYWSTTFENSTYIRHGGISLASNITPLDTHTLFGETRFLNASFDPYHNFIVLSEVANATVKLFRTKEYTGFPYGYNNTPTDRQAYYNTWLYRKSITMTAAGTGNKQFNVTLNATHASDPYTVYIDPTHVQNDLDDLRITDSQGETLEYNLTPTLSLANLIYTTEPPTPTPPINETWYPRNTTLPETSSSVGMEYMPDGHYYVFGGGNDGTGYCIKTTDTDWPIGSQWSLENESWPISDVFGSGTQFKGNLYYVDDQPYPWYSEGDEMCKGPWRRNSTAIVGGNVHGRLIGNDYLGKIFWINGALKVYSSTDGRRYTILNESAFPGRTTMAAAAVAVNPRTGEMWAIGEAGANPQYVYHSFDGDVWTLRNASFNPTGNNQERLVWAGTELIYVGGIGSQKWYNSTDGAIWGEHSTASWPATSAPGIAYNTTSGEVMMAYGSAVQNVYTISRTGIGSGYYLNWSLVNVHKPIAGNYGNYLFYGNATATSNSTGTIFDTLSMAGTFGAEEGRSTIHKLDYNGSATLDGTAQTLSIPEIGGTVTVGTTTNVTTLSIGETGFTVGFTVGGLSGNSKTISASDAATFVVDGRGLGINIYDITGVLKGTYTAGGIINSADIDDKSALWLVAGGNDGKVYIFSKSSSSSWTVSYTGDSMDYIYATATSMRGEYAAVGRKGGAFEYYNLQSAIAAALSGAQTNWYSPHQVSIKIVDFWGKQITGANVMASVNASSFPAGTDWLKSIYGINSTAANEMMNGTLLMSGRTGSDGTITFTMHSSLEYNITVSEASLVTSTKYLYPASNQYTLYITPVTSTIGNSTQIQLVNTSLYITEPDINHVTFNFTYQDTSGFTQDVVWNVTCWDNRTVMYAKRWTGNVLPLVVLADNYTVPNVRGQEWRFMYNSTRSAV